MGIFLFLLRLRLRLRREKVSSLGQVVDGVVLVVVGVRGIKAAPRGPDVEGLGLAEAGPGFGTGSGSSVGLDGGFPILIGGFCLLEDVDNVLALFSRRVSMLAS